jgi:hypothetical protein
MPHTPPEHAAEPLPEVGPAQTFPHEPQLMENVDVLTQTPPQLVCPGAQQMPEMQLNPAPQT